MKKCLLVALFVFSAVPLRAEPITAGFLLGSSMSEPVSMSIQADGFAFGGRAAPWAGVFGPAMDCMNGRCAPDRNVRLDAFWSGSDLSGGAVWNDVEYDNAYMEAKWSGSLYIPQEFTGGIIRAPFTFEGAFYNGNAWLTLLGFGMASAEFGAITERGFQLSKINYAFGPLDEELTPNPEPGTLLLMGTGAAMLARKYRRRVQ
jgi:hypothetical protein